MAEEQATNGNVKPIQEPGETGKRQVSSIQFPYNDLDDAVTIARTVNRIGGTACTLEQLSGALGVQATSGPFRVRVSNASTFGLTDNERGEVRLTELGRAITDTSQEAEARAQAFLHVPLYQPIYEKYRRYSLPPPAALEREMQALGVSSKQTDKARQAFMRSARQAGFFAYGEDRLVRPSFNPIATTAPIEMPKQEGEKRRSGGGEPPNRGLHPFIEGLLQTLPPPESDWPTAARAKWLQTAANIFDLIYKGDGGIKIEAAIAQRSPRPE